MVWLDVLDLPLVYYMEASYHVDGPRQTVKPGRGDRVYARGGMVPTPVFERTEQAPTRCCATPGSRRAPRCEALAADQPELAAVQITYVNPETGGDAQNILGFYALMLRPGQSAAAAGALAGDGVPPDRRRAPRCRSTTSASRSAEADTCCAPGYTAVTLTQSLGECAGLPLHRRRDAAAPEARRVREPRLTPITQGL